MTEREKVKDMVSGLYLSGSGYVDTITDFIMEDRRRICSPLIEHKQSVKDLFGNGAWGQGADVIAIDKTLKLAGLEDFKP